MEHLLYTKILCTLHAYFILFNKVKLIYLTPTTTLIRIVHIWWMKKQLQRRRESKWKNIYIWIDGESQTGLAKLLIFIFLSLFNL